MWISLLTRKPEIMILITMLRFQGALYSTLLAINPIDADMDQLF